ncbi:hypothetical protein Tco_0386662 [Tanacetum coccineum]
MWVLEGFWIWLIAYSDADIAGCLDDYKSTSGGIRFLGDKLVSWSSKKHDCTSMSTAELSIRVLATILEDSEQVETPDNPFIAPVNIEIIQSLCRGLAIKELLLKLEEDYHSIKDDIPLVSVYTTRNVTIQGMLIPDAFLTDEIRATNDYKEYETVYVKVPTLTAASPQGKKRKQSAGETCSPRKSLKVTIKQKPNTTSIPPPSDDREQDEIAEATLLSLTLQKTALAAEA